MGEYTPEPWELFSKGTTIAVMDRSRKEIVHWAGFDSSHFRIKTQRANARRIVACVNACKGIETETLEQHEGELIEAHVVAKDTANARADASEAALERAVGLLRGLVDHAIPTMEIELDDAGEEEIEAWQAARAFLDKQGEG